MDVTTEPVYLHPNSMSETDHEQVDERVYSNHELDTPGSM